MKHIKKLFVFVVALVTAFGIALPALAESGEGQSQANGTISITTNFKGQEYKLYKLFDAQVSADASVDNNGVISGITYTLMSGKSGLTEGQLDGATWFDIDGNGRVTAKSNIQFNDAFKTWAAAYGVQQGTKLEADTNNDPDIKWENLTPGYYFITTTTGSLVTVDSITPDVEVQDKNSIPSGDKTIASADAGDVDAAGKNAIAQVGTQVTFNATVTFGKGSKNVKFHDTMGSGLAFVQDSITVSGVAANEWRVQDSADDGDTFTIAFNDGIAEGTTATISYKATVTSDALTTLVAEGTNTATISYGEKNTTTAEKTTQVYNAKFTVTKIDGKTKNALSGAGFVIKNAGGKYYKIANNVVTWVNSIDDATEYKSGTDGKVQAFTGLANGTYTLVEKTVPGGYNKLNDSTFTIAEDDYSPENLVQGKTVENNQGTEMPSTGGIGTTIFYVVGGVMVAGAVVFLLTKRRVNAE